MFGAGKSFRKPHVDIGMRFYNLVDCSSTLVDFLLCFMYSVFLWVKYGSNSVQVGIHPPEHNFVRKGVFGGCACRLMSAR